MPSPLLTLLVLAEMINDVFYGFFRNSKHFLQQFYLEASPKQLTRRGKTKEKGCLSFIVSLCVIPNLVEKKGKIKIATVQMSTKDHPRLLEAARVLCTQPSAKPSTTTSPQVGHGVSSVHQKSTLRRQEVLLLYFLLGKFNLV